MNVKAKVKELLVILKGLFIIYLISTEPVHGCMKLGSNKCLIDDDCCSAYCSKQPNWKYGLCKHGNKIIGTEVSRGESGACSYYHGGGITASGEPFNENEMTAAHRTLPFNTLVRVEDTDEERSVLVRINDRGPFVDGRILDLSLASAKRLGIIRKGVIPCRYVVVAYGSKNNGRCKPVWNNTCLANGECCSKNCYKPPEWTTGICKPRKK